MVEIRTFNPYLWNLFEDDLSFENDASTNCERDVKDVGDRLINTVFHFGKGGQMVHYQFYEIQDVNNNPL